MQMMRRDHGLVSMDCALEPRMPRMGVDERDLTIRVYPGDPWLSHPKFMKT
jgi:hypothetical protein